MRIHYILKFNNENLKISKSKVSHEYLAVKIVITCLLSLMNDNVIIIIYILHFVTTFAYVCMTRVLTRAARCHGIAKHQKGCASVWKIQ